jgi:hypothetical protein
MEIQHYVANGKDTDMLTVYSLAPDGNTQNLGGRYDSDGKFMVVSVKNSTGIVVVYNDVKLKDLADNHWAGSYVSSMAAKGLINGYSDGSFKPDNQITRAEFAVLITKLLKLNTDIEGTSFTDVKETDWFSKYIEAAAKANIINGWNGMFNPNENISRQDAAVILSKAVQYFNINRSDSEKEIVFADKELISDYAASHINTVTGFNIMTGKPGNLFDPKGFTKRAEVAKMIYTLYNLI